jgi:hypothetical protein
MDFKLNREGLFDAYESKKASLDASNRLVRNKVPIIYDDWEWYFDDKSRTNKLYTYLQKTLGPLKQKGTGRKYDWPLFVKNYACDKSWAISGGFCKTNFSSEGWDSCVDKVNGTKNSDGTITYDSNTYKEKVTLTKDHTWKSASGKSGTWSCAPNGLVFLEEKSSDKKEDDKKKEEDKKKKEPIVIGGGCEKVDYTEDDILSGNAELKNCMKGSIVGKIQSLLKTCGFPYFSKSGNIDNIYGPRTEKMVKAFQELPNIGLIDDGVVGDKTYKKLLACKSGGLTITPTPTPTPSSIPKFPEPGSDDEIFNFN